MRGFERKHDAYKAHFLSFMLILPFVQFEWLYTSYFSNTLLIQTNHTTCVSFSCQFICVGNLIMEVFLHKKNTEECSLHFCIRIITLTQKVMDT